LCSFGQSEQVVDQLARVHSLAIQVQSNPA
jgi:hypothetical protein